MSGARVLGIDPGPIPGVVLLAIDDGRLFEHELLQCTQGIASRLVESLLKEDPHVPALVQVERFVVSRRSGRSSTAKAGVATRELIGELRRVVEDLELTISREEVRLVQRNASEVKAWATDQRLEAAGLLEATKGMRHARDAARHALFAAVKSGALPDPLSKEFKR